MSSLWLGDNLSRVFRKLKLRHDKSRRRTWQFLYYYCNWMQWSYFVLYPTQSVSHVFQSRVCLGYFSLDFSYATTVKNMDSSFSQLYYSADLMRYQLSTHIKFNESRCSRGIYVHYSIKSHNYIIYLCTHIWIYVYIKKRNFFYPVLQAVCITSCNNLSYYIHNLLITSYKTEIYVYVVIITTSKPLYFTKYHSINWINVLS